MKKLFLGVLLGAAFTGVAFYFSLPGIKQTSYDNGFAAGNKSGIATGTAAGVTQGITELKATQKREHDSLETLRKKKEAALKARTRVPKKVVRPIQNWHVIDGKIQDPIPDSTTD